MTGRLCFHRITLHSILLIMHLFSKLHPSDNNYKIIAFSITPYASGFLQTQRCIHELERHCE